MFKISTIGRPEGIGHQRLATMALAFSCVLGAAACGGSSKDVEKPEPPTDTKPDKDAWRDQSLSLSVLGYQYTGALKPQPAKWAGSAAWIGSNVAVTNAHVALRGVGITGTDDRGNKYEFTEILAIDQQADLAIIRAPSVSDRPSLALLDKPSEPKDLRGKTVRVIGNTGDLGLSFYDGRITNVVGEEGGAVLLHDANTAGGSSGGPLIENETGKLVGVNHSSLPSLNAKAAAPSWIVKALMDQASTNTALPLTKAFAPTDLPVNWYVERAVCMKPGEVFKGVFAAVATNDLVVDITPAQADAPMGFILARGKQALAQQVIKGKALGAWTLKGGGQYVYALLNPKQAKSPVCATVRFGRIDWAKRLN